MEEKRLTKQLSQLIKDSATTPNFPRSEYETDGFWFPTPETCSNPETLEGINKKIYNAIAELKKAESLSPHSPADKRRFLSQFQWRGTLLTPQERQAVEILLLEFHDIFARHRLDIGRNDDFKIKLTPEHDRPVYTQSPPTPIHIREELQIELALLQYYGVLTTLPFSKYSSPIFAQRKPPGKLRLLIDLRKTNHLIRHDYDANNFPISTMADAGSHLAGKKYFCKLDCSQAYFAFQMADARSVQMLAFNFASRTYAFLRLAQGLSRSVSAFSSFMRQQLDKCILADQCFQYVDDVGTASHTPSEMLINLRSLFECIRSSGLKLSPSKCVFGMASVQFLGSTITSQGMSPIQQKIDSFIQKLKPPRNVRQVRRFIGFCQFYKAYLPRLAEKLLPFYQLLRSDSNFELQEGHHTTFENLIKELKMICDTQLRLPKRDLQYVILADASFYAAGYVLMVEDYPNNATEKPKQYAPVCFGSRVFQPAQLKLSIYAKEFLAVHFALDTFAHIVWGAQKPVLILTDNKSLTRFFQAKNVPGSLWNAVDHVLSFPFMLGHIPGRANLAADYLSRLPIDAERKMSLRLKDRLPTYEVHVDMKAKTPATDHDETKSTDDVLDDINATGNNNLLHIHTTNDTPTVDSLTVFKVPRSLCSLQSTNPTNTTFETSTSPLDMAKEQGADSTLSCVKSWLTGSPINNLYLDLAQKKYLKQLPRLLLDDGIIYRKFFDHTGNNCDKQICVPKHLQEEIVNRFHNSKFKSHNGLLRTLHDFRKSFYFPGYHEFILDHIKNCLTCLQAKPSKPTALRPPLQPVASKQNFPSDMLQVDLVGRLPNVGNYKFILTAIDVFSRYLFAIPLTNASAHSVAQALTSIFMRHSYIPKLILTDLGTVFTSDLFKELTQLLQVELRHASLKHAQTIGLLERSHSALKRVLKIHDNGESSGSHNWFKYVDTAVFVHNTSYHTAIGFTRHCFSTEENL